MYPKFNITRSTGVSYVDQAVRTSFFIYKDNIIKLLKHNTCASFRLHAFTSHGFLTRTRFVDTEC